MGKQKSGWSRGTVIVIIAIGFLFTGVFLSNYFFAKAIGQSSNHSKSEHIKRAAAKGPTTGSIAMNTKDSRLEKERMQKQQDQAESWRNKQEQVPETIPPETSKEPPATQETGTPQTTEKETTGDQQEQNNTPPQGKNKTIYLTFDDGPAPFSADIIALLEKYQYKATFFMIDGNIRRYPDAVKLMVQNGETVGLHSVSHNQKAFYASVDSIISELTQNRNTLKEISGIDSYIMRTPYGSVPQMTVEYRQAVKDRGYFMWDWNIDSKDWYYKDGRYVTSVIEQLTKLADHNGPLVILLHERPETLAHLPALLDYLRAQGFTGKAIDNSMTPVQFNAR
ncbi:polysaccharide deacetylase family protein [Neobacillus sp. MM2021_6]|uniref:polysaccharide deacetylase family protein n=1 Tax=Bacillaceae TaxID=186817 RepID=UPI00140BB2FA|nr:MULTISPECIES: polysaccharide deacetylase family protein [Bacillaceae]MBO0958986.1 polysaccharide deacetylase family protein [Neobacillus sp. MM2021_6]NHC17716.1 polysaccharide deacetylase family protein [Bacillus sp. MM2020_4]